LYYYIIPYFRIKCHRKEFVTAVYEFYWLDEVVGCQIIKSILNWGEGILVRIEIPKAFISFKRRERKRTLGVFGLFHSL